MSAASSRQAAWVWIIVAISAVLLIALGISKAFFYEGGLASRESVEALNQRAKELEIREQIIAKEITRIEQADHDAMLAYAKARCHEVFAGQNLQLKCKTWQFQRSYQ